MHLSLNLSLSEYWITSLYAQCGIIAAEEKLTYALLWWKDVNSVKRWKQGYITPPLPYFILWNEVTSLGGNKVIQEPSPILHCICQLGENKGGRGHWVSQNSYL